MQVYKKLSEHREESDRIHYTKNVRIVSILFAITTYILVGSFITSLANEIYGYISDFDFTNPLGPTLIIPIFMLPTFLIFRYAYSKQMNLLGSKRFVSYLENQRRNSLNESIFLFTTKEKVSEKYADVDMFAKNLIPVAIIILAVAILMGYKEVLAYNGLNLLNYLAGLAFVVFTFSRKTKE